MVRPIKGSKPMTSKIEVRIAPDQKDMIHRALAGTSVVSVASVARDLLLRAAGDLLLVDAGKLTPEEAGRRYTAYITTLSSSADLADLPGASLKMESAKDESSH